MLLPSPSVDTAGSVDITELELKSRKGEFIKNILNQLKCMDIALCFSAIFTKGNNFYDLLLASLQDIAVPDKQGFVLEWWPHRKVGNKTCHRDRIARLTAHKNFNIKTLTFC